MFYTVDYYDLAARPGGKDVLIGRFSNWPEAVTWAAINLPPNSWHIMPVSDSAAVAST